MSRRDGANAGFFVEKSGPVLRHLRPPMVPKLGAHSYGQNLSSIELNPKGMRTRVVAPPQVRDEPGNGRN
jgi:hypothetical protein